MKQKYLSIVSIVLSSIGYASEEDFFKIAKKDLTITVLNCRGVCLYQRFMEQMLAITPDDDGNRYLGYTIPAIKRNRMRVRITKAEEVIDEIEQIILYEEHFDVFKGFRMAQDGALFITKDLDKQKFNQLSPAIRFLNVLLIIFDQIKGRVHIPLLDEKDARFVIWQTKSRHVVGAHQKLKAYRVKDKQD